MSGARDRGADARGWARRASPAERGALASVLLLAALPALCGVIYSVWASLQESTGGIGLAHYRRLFQSGDLASSLGFTAQVTAMATVLSFVVAMAIVLALRGGAISRRGTPGAAGPGAAARSWLAVPLPVPHLVAGAVFVQLLAAGGILARCAHALGWIGGPDDFPPLMTDRLGIGIVLAYAWKEVPWLALVMLSTFDLVGNRYERAAATLGAAPRRRFTRVTLPLVLRGVAPSAVLLVAFLLGAFELPLLLGRSWPPMLSVLAYQRFQGVDLDRRPEAFAVSTLLTVCIGITVWVARRLGRRVGQR